jgi:uncharacterized protein (DUF488 family)
MNKALLHTIYTIGHGRQPFETFLALLKQHRIEFLCDVRSAARSRWPQFNGAALERALIKHGIGYEHLPECGGKLPVPVAERLRGLDRIIELAGELRIILMCSESQPLTSHSKKRANCHRVGLLALPLRQRGAEIIHILPDGTTLVIDEAEVPSQW